MKKSYLISCVCVVFLCLAAGWLVLPTVDAISASKVQPEAGETTEVVAEDANSPVQVLSSKVRGKPYSKARDVVVSEGWMPVSNPKPDELMFVTRIMYEAGYVEVDACAPTGSAPCTFYFQKGLDYLRVATDHEDPVVVLLEVKTAEIEGLNPFLPAPEPLDLNSLRE